MALQRLLHERQRGSFVAGFRDIALQDLAFVIHRTPEVDHFTITYISSRCHRQCLNPRIWFTR